MARRVVPFNGASDASGAAAGASQTAMDAGQVPGLIREEYGRLREGLLKTLDSQLRQQEQTLLSAVEERCAFNAPGAVPAAGKASAHSSPASGNNSGMAEFSSIVPQAQLDAPKKLLQSEPAESKAVSGTGLAASTLEAALSPIREALKRIETRLDGLAAAPLSLPPARDSPCPSITLAASDELTSHTPPPLMDLQPSSGQNSRQGDDELLPCTVQKRTTQSSATPSTAAKKSLANAWGIFDSDEDLDDDLKAKPKVLFTQQPTSAIGMFLADKHAELEQKDRAFWKQRILERAVMYLEWWTSLEEPPRSGPLATVVGSSNFEIVCSLVILLNAVFMLHTTDYAIQNIGAKPTPFIVFADNCFLVFFGLELVLKLIVHRMYFWCNDEMKWNIFDFFLVAIALYDNISASVVPEGTQESANNMTFMRTLRILKMAKSLRALRLLHCVSELRVVLNSVLGSFLSLFWSLFMLVFIFYLFSLVFVQSITTFLADNLETMDKAFHDDLLEHFGSVVGAMLSCYKATTGGDDWSQFYNLFAVIGWHAALMYLFFIGFMQIALMNILTGIFVEHAMKLAQPEYNALALEQRKKDISEAAELRRLFASLDSDGSGKISPAEFKAKLRDDKLRSYLSVLGLEIRDATFFFEMLAEISDTKSVDLDFFVDACLKMKGSATSLDMQSLAFETKVIHKRFFKLEAQMGRLLTTVNSLPSPPSHHSPRTSVGIASTALAPLPAAPSTPAEAAAAAAATGALAAAGEQAPPTPPAPPQPAPPAAPSSPAPALAAAAGPVVGITAEPLSARAATLAAARQRGSREIEAVSISDFSTGGGASAEVGEEAPQELPPVGKEDSVRLDSSQGEQRGSGVEVALDLN